MGRGLNMNILISDPHHDEEFAKSIGAKFVSMDDLLAESDIISVHVPYMKATHHLINDEAISKMKNGAYIINTARGGIIDTDAMVRALQSGKIGGVGLDVMEEEDKLKQEKNLRLGQQEAFKTIMQDHILIDMNNVIVTPHIASSTHEAIKLRMQQTAENIKSFICGNPQNLVEIK